MKIVNSKLYVSLKGTFFQKVRCVFQISKKLFQITILSLKFEFDVYCYWREIHISSSG